MAPLADTWRRLTRRPATPPALPSALPSAAPSVDALTGLTTLAGTALGSPDGKHPAKSIDPADLERALAENGAEKDSSSSSSPTDPSDPPDGGGAAWIQVGLCWLTLFNTWGFINAYGAFHAHYTTVTLPTTPASTIAWIGTLQAAGVSFWGLPAGAAYDRGFFRPVYVAGTALTVAATVALSFSSALWQLFLCQGVLIGLGGGLLFTPALSVVSSYFARRRAIATGVATTGTAVGGLIYPLLCRELLARIGFGWTIRVIALVNLVALGACCLFFRPRVTALPAGAPHPPLLDLSSLRDIPFVLYSVGICIVSMPQYFVFYYISNYAIDMLGMPFADSLNMIMIINGIGVPARLLPGFLADRYLGTFNTYTPLILAAGAVVFGWLAVGSVPGLYAWVAVFGFLSAGYQAMYGAVVAALTPSPDKIGIYLGVSSAIGAFTGPAGAPIGGFILSAANGNYKPAIIWAGALYLLGGGLIIWSRVARFGTSLKLRC